MTDSVDVPIIAPAIPVYAHPGDAGADLVAAEAATLLPGERVLVSTGVRIALPDGYAAFVVPRSGLAAKHGITVVNSPGTVDAGYRGEIKVCLLNTDARETYDVAPGDRIAQMIVMPVTRARFLPVESLDESARGVGGFGSTGYQTSGDAVRDENHSPVVTGVEERA
ncbi:MULTISPECIES: dUTP diphosphatase [Bacteria]|uniref:dUTP diphosphatase n=1 Tax=Bacteria TaxID=2 RepID=UPI003C7A6927